MRPVNPDKVNVAMFQEDANKIQGSRPAGENDAVNVSEFLEPVQDKLTTSH
jgi:hypothetical protein